MPVQDYNINTRNAVAGQTYGLSYSIAPMSWTVDFTAAFGAPVVRSGDRTATDTTGLTADTAFFLDGITIRTVNHEQNSRPGDGLVAYSVGDVAAVLQEGQIQVLVEDAFVVEGLVYVEEATGKWFAANAAGRSQALNVRFESSGAASSIGLVRIATNKVLSA